MNHSGDAAEQIVRMTLEGVEVAARITGTAAKEIALLLLAALKSPDKSAGKKIKLKGKERLNSMLKSGKALEIFSVRESDLRTFVREAKRYGIVYCVLRKSKQTPDGLCDIMVKADDAPKINRIVERFKFAAVDKAKIESEIMSELETESIEWPAGQAARSATESSKEEDNYSNEWLDNLLGTGEGNATKAGAEPDEPEINDIDRLLDDLMGTDEGKAAPDSPDQATISREIGKAEVDRVAPDSPDRVTTAPGNPAPGIEKSATDKTTTDTLSQTKTTQDMSGRANMAPNTFSQITNVPGTHDHAKAAQDMSSRVNMAPDTFSQITNVPGTHDHAKTAQDNPAPKKSSLKKPTRKSDRKSEINAPIADVRSEIGPLASGGRNSADSPPPPKTSPSEPFSESKKKSRSHISSKPSVKAELGEIAAMIKVKEIEALKREQSLTNANNKANTKGAQTTTHKQPQNRRKSKTKRAR